MAAVRFRMLASQTKTITGMMNKVDYAFEEIESNVLGRGGFGVVYRGYAKKNPGQALAIKKSQYTSSAQSMTDLKNELWIMMQILFSGCEHLVLTKDFAMDQIQGHTFMVMEFCDGGDLLNLLHVHRRLNPQVLQKLALQVSLALYELNERNIIHRDLKPANILITYVPGRTRSLDNIIFKVGDFGISRRLDVNSLAMTMAGTPIYLAPEVLLGRPYDNRVDVWSLGVILHECLSGHHPFDYTNAIAYAIQTINCHCLEVNPSQNSDAIALIIRMLAVDQKDRMKMRELFNHPYVNTAEFREKIANRTQARRQSLNAVEKMRNKT